MKKIYNAGIKALFAFTIIASAGSAFAQGPLSAGNLIVLQVGNGTGTLTNTGNAVFLKEYTRTAAPQATPLTTIAVPVNGAARLVVSGTAATEGLISLSTDSTHIILSGYDTSTSNVAPLPGSTSANIKRVVDTVGSSGVVGRAAMAMAFSGSNIRGAVKSSGNDYWAVGGNSGVQYLGNSSTGTALGTSITNIRAIQAANGNLYFSSVAGSSAGITKITGMPTVSGTNVGVQLFSTGTGSQSGDFSVNATETIVYIADSRANAAGGIQKWILTAGVWSVADTLVVGAGARGLAVDWSAAFPVLYATTSDNRLVTLIDSSYAAGYANGYVTIATAPTGTAFRGVAFTPKAASGCTAPALATSVTNATCTNSGSIVLTATGGSTITSYAWVGAGGFVASTQNLSNLSAGTYLVTVTTVGGCTATATATVSNTGTGTATATAAGPTSFCQGDSVIINANTGPRYTYQWFNGPTAIAGATASSYAATASGGYSVQVTSGSCTTASTAVAVNVGAPVNAAVTALGPTTFCAGDSVQLRAGRGAGLTYQWYHNGTAVPGAGDSVLVVNMAGNYRLIVSNGSCTDTSSAISVIVHPNPVAILSAAPDSTFCQGDSTVLMASAGAGFTYSWFMNGSPLPGASGPTRVARISGNYRVIVTNSAGCADTSRALQIRTKPLPSPSALYSNGQFVAQNAGMYTNIRWFLLGGTTPVANGPVFTPTVSGTYVLYADSNGCTGIGNPVAIALGVFSVAKTTFTISPNPTQNAFEILPAGAYQVRITDLQGRTVLQKETTSRVDISQLSNGLYMLHVQKAGEATAVPVRLLKQ